MPLSGMDGLPLVALVQMTLHLCSVCLPTRLSNHVHLKILELFSFQKRGEATTYFNILQQLGRGMSKIMIFLNPAPPHQILKSRIFWTDGTMQHSRQLWESKVARLACSRGGTYGKSHHCLQTQYTNNKQYTNIHATAAFLQLSVYNNIVQAHPET